MMPHNLKGGPAALIIDFALSEFAKLRPTKVKIGVHLKIQMRLQIQYQRLFAFD